MKAARSSGFRRAAAFKAWSARRKAAYGVSQGGAADYEVWRGGYEEGCLHDTHVALCIPHFVLFLPPDLVFSTFTV